MKKFSREEIEAGIQRFKEIREKEKAGKNHWPMLKEEKEIFPAVEFSIQLRSKKFNGDSYSLLEWKKSEDTIDAEFIDLIETNFPEFWPTLQRFLPFQ